MDNSLCTKLKASLLFTRISIFLVFLMWTLDKILNPQHGSKVFEMFYGLSVTTEVMMVIGFLQLALVVAFGLGLWKKWLYLAILVLHTGSTFSSMPLYFDPFNNLLFFAAWPMLSACFILYIFREYDTWDVNRLYQIGRNT